MSCFFQDDSERSIDFVLVHENDGTEKGEKERSVFVNKLKEDGVEISEEVRHL